MFFRRDSNDKFDEMIARLHSDERIDLYLWREDDFLIDVIRRLNSKDLNFLFSIERNYDEFIRVLIANIKQNQNNNVKFKNNQQVYEKLNYGGKILKK